MEKKRKGQDKNHLPEIFSKHINTILGAADNQSTKEANIRWELNELRGRANEIRALCEVILKGNGVSLNLDSITIGELAKIGMREASDIHNNVNSLEGLLHARPYGC